ncbi:hypothetical protein RJ639_031239 [Escallonia herrerae]|uniref:Uncharacterized protein n=1 Tax=Escallonia herrerae TaxID=1293975 RepID=A0AA88X3D5_9ASTE|nr:hypothetical protein RJ639_031239 [Escallonia herrerae]
MLRLNVSALETRDDERDHSLILETQKDVHEDEDENESPSNRGGTYNWIENPYVYGRSKESGNEDHDLDYSLQRLLYNYLEAKGMKLNIDGFSHMYMTGNKQKDDFLWLKQLAEFTKAQESENHSRKSCPKLSTSHLIDDLWKLFHSVFAYGCTLLGEALSNSSKAHLHWDDNLGPC